MVVGMILSGGTGSRMHSAIPKQYLEVGGKPLISYSLKTLGNSEEICGFIVVAAKEWQELILQCVAQEKLEDQFLGFAKPGENRQLSIYSGLCYLNNRDFHQRNTNDEGDSEGNVKGNNEGNVKGNGEGDSEGNVKGNIEGNDEGNVKGNDEGDSEGSDERNTKGTEKEYDGEKDVENSNMHCSATDYVLVHDAARPFLTKEDIAQYVAAVGGHDGVLPVLPMKDTIYQSLDGKSVDGLLDRSTLYAGQAPELFRMDLYKEANEQLITFDTEGNIKEDSQIFCINGSTEVAIKAGMDVVMVPGNENNFKVTTVEDLQRAKALLSGR